MLVQVNSLIARVNRQEFEIMDHRDHNLFDSGCVWKIHSGEGEGRAVYKWGSRCLFKVLTPASKYYCSDSSLLSVQMTVCVICSQTIVLPLDTCYCHYQGAQYPSIAGYSSKQNGDPSMIQLVFQHQSIELIPKP